jgi:malate dehydrogenase (oxaloacetate-decarboxylating)
MASKKSLPVTKKTTPKKVAKTVVAKTAVKKVTKKTVIKKKDPAQPLQKGVRVDPVRPTKVGVRVDPVRPTKVGVRVDPARPAKVGVRVDYAKMALALHKKLKGKLEVVSKGKLETRDDWSTMYSPGVGAVSSHLAKYPKDAREYTIKKNTVAVISDGSAIFGLGNLGAIPALPVMEGKCAIFKAMAGVDAFPIVLDTQDPEEVIKVMKAIAPTFGGINLEDFAAPHCFVIEERLKAELSIPVMHDDQHGTAIVVLAGLINAAKVVGKKFEDLKIVVVGAGAAGRAVTLLLKKAGISHDYCAIVRERFMLADLTSTGYKKDLALTTNTDRLQGDVQSVVAGADVLIGLSGPGTIAPAHVEKMAEKPIVFALANPIPKSCPRMRSVRVRT